jgi:hypothetical protein
MSHILLKSSIMKLYFHCNHVDLMLVDRSLLTTLSSHWTNMTAFCSLNLKFSLVDSFQRFLAFILNFNRWFLFWIVSHIILGSRETIQNKNRIILFTLQCLVEVCKCPSALLFLWTKINCFVPTNYFSFTDV